jgi:uncharacterized membrane protein
VSEDDRPDEPASEQFLVRLEPEVERWQRERLIGARQATAILARYGLRPPAAVRAWRVGRLASIVAILGAILVGVGIILLIASNRQEFDLPRGLKVGLIMGTVVFLYAVGYVLRYELRFTAVGSAIIFLGTIFYGAAVFLVGQIYNVQPNEPRLFLYWFVGVIPLAYLARSSAIFALSALVAAAGLGMQAAVWMEDGGSSQVSAIRILALYGILGPLYYALAHVHAGLPPLRDLHRPLQVIGLVTTFAALCGLGFTNLFDLFDLGDEPIPDLLDRLVLVYSLLASATVASFVAALYLWRRSLASLPYEAAAGLSLLGLAFATAYLPIKEPEPYIVLYNVLLLAALLGTVAVGVARDRETYVNIGLAFFAILVLIRYFDWASGLLDRSVVFLGTGALVLAGAALLENYRRRLLRQMRSG